MPRGDEGGLRRARLRDKARKRKGASTALLAFLLHPLIHTLALAHACRHPNDELNFCYYLIPCGKEGHCGNVTEADLARLHNDAIKKDPFISAALGPNVKIERMRAAALRLGGQGLTTTYDDHMLIIGDAAGEGLEVGGG
jgi:hypothetical protein